ncbi:hypothetical protein QEN19_000522 [Hanseniaspora menglaensis]
MFSMLTLSFSFRGVLKDQCKNKTVWNSFLALRNYNVKFEDVRNLKDRVHPEYQININSKLQTLKWLKQKPMKNIFIVKKPNTPETTEDMTYLICKLLSQIYYKYENFNIIVQEKCKLDIKNSLNQCGYFDETFVLYSGSDEEIVNKADLMITLGGDGTILHAVAMFNKKKVPPVLPISLGTLGFLLPYQMSEFDKAFQDIMNNKSKVIYRTRLACYLDGKILKSDVKENLNGESGYNKVFAMNDIFIYRGNSPHLLKMDIFIDGEKLTTAIADGVILSTPTGSTAYSLSSGGSIVSPRVPCIMLTPICPRSLSFRPLILPYSSHIKIKIVDTKRVSKLEDSPAKLSIDSVVQCNLNHNDEIHVINEVGTIYTSDNQDIPFKDMLLVNNEHISKNQHHGIHCIAKDENDWTHGINELLGFNSSFKSIR